VVASALTVGLAIVVLALTFQFGEAVAGDARPVLAAPQASIMKALVQGFMSQQPVAWALFGVGAIRDTKQVQLVVNLETWDPQKNYDRIGAEESTVEILGVHVPSVLIPIRPGRNIPVIIETAARNERLKKMGYHSAKEFNRNVQNWLETESARAIFLSEK